jgi:MFS family permease
VGLLYSAVGVGSAIGSVFSGFVGHMRNPGRAVVVAVILWGLSIVAFGLSTFSFVVAFVLMCVAAAADAISGVGRGTILQTIAPDNLRGRLSSVNYVVVVGGPYIGDIESGAAATLLNLRLAVITGGLLCLAGAALTAVRMPQLWRYERILEPAPVEVPDAAEPAGAPAEPPGG